MMRKYVGWVTPGGETSGDVRSTPMSAEPMDLRKKRTWTVTSV